ncbi:unnamed protein product [Symbiodinium sp. CCMP2456]|nr:unnamed protein product [Symbiodinium sp. CCMP2456]
MGCSGSIEIKSEPQATSKAMVVLLVPETVELSPRRAAPPSFDTHRQYVQKLNRYLIDVAKNPNAFESRVNVRREARFAELAKGRSRPVDTRHSIQAVAAA